MNQTILLILTLLSCSLLKSYGQAGNLDVEGAIRIGNSTDSMPEAGTIQWTGTDLLVWNGTNWISLTNGITYEGEVTDIDGNTYRTVRIGFQVWMAENLRTNHYADGTEIPKINNATSWQNANYGAWSWYDTTSTYEQPYGKLYNWFAVVDGRNLCPIGWHEPSDQEWTLLTNFLGGEMVAGTKMKETGTAHWKYQYLATNESGFTGLPGGYRDTDGTFYNDGYFGYWWSTTEYLPGSALTRDLDLDSAVAERYALDKSAGLSVRCLKD